MAAAIAAECSGRRACCCGCFSISSRAVCSRLAIPAVAAPTPATAGALEVYSPKKVVNELLQELLDLLCVYCAGV
jgi:hypothetical protein